MMPTPRVSTRQTSEPYVVPAPIGGLNGRDPLASMAPTDAYVLDNLFPGTASVLSRKGSVKHNPANVLAGPVQTMEVYAGATGDKMLAWAAGNVYDVSLAAPVLLYPTGVLPQLLSSVVISTMFSNSADTSQHLIIVNGFDTPQHYDGAAITNLTMTGITTPSDLNFVYAFKERLYFGAKQKLGFYYLPTGQIQGALSFFDLAQVASRGGYLQAIASYSDGSGETPADYIVFITSKGECIVYAGYNPANAATWELVGRYYAATPIGQRCAINYNGELLVITKQGVVPFSVIRSTGATSQGITKAASEAITSKLGRILDDYVANATVAGWQGVEYSLGGWLLINAPEDSAISGHYHQFVMNTTTGAWCRFKDLNGISWCVFNGRLYFGRYDGYILLADEGRLDDTANIQCDAKQAYNYFADERGAGPLQKHFQWAALIVQCDGEPPLSGKFNVDFKEEQPEYVITLAASAGATWDVATWDLAEWGTEGFTQRVFVTLNKGGFAGSLWMRLSLQGLTFEWFATQYVLERTKGLLI